eukprot:356698-Chlamydomonas_euryale.AAC.11
MARAWASCSSILPCMLPAQPAACTDPDTHATAQRTDAAARRLSSSGNPAGGLWDAGSTNQQGRGRWQRAAREHWRAVQRAAAERRATGDAKGGH